MSAIAPILNSIRIIPRDEEFLNRKLGSRGEIFYDRDSNSLRLYDGRIAGGISLAKTDLTNVDLEDFRKKSVESKLATVIYNVTVTGPQSPDTGNKYNLNAVYRLEPNFVVGYTYVFVQDDQTNVYFPNSNNTTPNPHPLNFSADNLSGQLGGGTSYLTDVRYFLNGNLVTQAAYNGSAFNTATSRQVQITVTNSTPATLYYWCWNHTAMGNEISVADPGSGSGTDIGGVSVSVDNVAPTAPSQGNLWLDTTTGILYVYFADGDSEQWIQPVFPYPDISNLATESYVDTAIGNIPAVNLSSYAPLNSPTFTGTVGGITATMVGLGNVTNESKATMFSSPTFTGTVSGVTATHVGLGNVTNESKATMFTSPTFTGTVAGVTATHVGLGNVTNESKATMFTSPTFTGTATLQQTVEVLDTKTGATGTVVHDFSTGAIWYHSSISANFTANFTNVPTTDNRAISIALVLIQGATPYIPNVVQIDGTPVTINWQDNLTPTGNANKRDLVSFTLLRVGAAWSVIGSLSTYG